MTDDPAAYTDLIEDWEINEVEPQNWASWYDDGETVYLANTRDERIESDTTVEVRR